MKLVKLLAVFGALVLGGCADKIPGDTSPRYQHWFQTVQQDQKEAEKYCAARGKKPVLEDRPLGGTTWYEPKYETISGGAVAPSDKVPVCG